MNTFPVFASIYLFSPILYFIPDEVEDGVDSPHEHTKDVLSSGSASPTSQNSLEVSTATLPPQTSAMLRDTEHQLSPEFPIHLIRRPPPHLIDSHDDVEHRIPASYIEDPSNMAKR